MYCLHLKLNMQFLYRLTLEKSKSKAGLVSDILRQGLSKINLHNHFTHNLHSNLFCSHLMSDAHCLYMNGVM